MENYEKIKYLAKGVYGEVFLAKDKRNGKLCVIKISLGLNDDESDIKREIIAAKQLKSYDNTYVPNFIETFLDKDGKRCFTMEFIDGRDIYELTNSLSVVEGKLFFVIAIQTLLALKYIHSKNIIHNDLNGGNILITNNYKVKIIDFGWSCQYIPVTPIVWHNYGINQNVVTRKFIKETDKFIKEYTIPKTAKEYTNKDIYTAIMGNNPYDQPYTSCADHGNYLTPPEIARGDSPPTNRDFFDKFYFGRDVWGFGVMMMYVAMKQTPYQQLGIDQNNIEFKDNQKLIANMITDDTRFKFDHFDPDVNKFLEFCLKPNWKERPTIDQCIDYLTKKIFSKLNR